jgi:hypothetical protein
MKQWELDAGVEALKAKRSQQSFMVRGYLTDEVLEETAALVLQAREDAAKAREEKAREEAARKQTTEAKK